MSNVPAIVGWNQPKIMRPGTASCFNRNTGTEKLCTTSRECSSNSYTLPTSTLRSSTVRMSSAVSSVRSGPGWTNVQAHCCEMMRTGSADAGAVTLTWVQTCSATTRMITSKTITA